MNFYRPGHKVTCICPDDHLTYGARPRYNETVTIEKIVLHKDRVWFVLKGYPATIGYQPRFFRPLDHDFVAQTIKELALPQLKK